MCDQFVFLDLRGTKFKVYKSTFDKLKADKVKYTQTGDNEYYISRDPQFFKTIIDAVEYGESPSCFSIPFVKGAVREAVIFGVCSCKPEVRHSDICPLHKELLQLVAKVHRHTADICKNSCQWWL